MQLTRREFAVLSASSLITLTISSVDALAGPLKPISIPVDELHPIIVHEKLGAFQKIKVASKIHHVVASQQTSLTDGFTNMNFGPWKPGMPAFSPTGGQMSVFISNNGNWSFGGSFPSQPSTMNCTVALAIGLRSSTGQVVAFTDSGLVTSQGWTFNKQGNSPVIRNMWPNFVAGHDFKGSWLSHQIPRANHQQQNGGSQGSGGTDVGDVLITICDVLGVASLVL